MELLSGVLNDADLSRKVGAGRRSRRQVLVLHPRVLVAGTHSSRVVGAVDTQGSCDRHQDTQARLRGVFVDIHLLKER